MATHILCNHDDESQLSSVHRALNFQFKIKLSRRHVFRLSNGTEIKTPRQLVRVPEIGPSSLDPFCPTCESELSEVLMDRYDFLEETIDDNMQKLRNFINSLVEEIKIFDNNDKEPINRIYNYGIVFGIRQEVVGVLNDNIDDEVARNWVDQLLIYNDIDPTNTPAIKMFEETNIRDENKNNTCAICLDEFNDDTKEQGKSVVKLDCEHLFHKRCVVSWVQINQSCPLCRFELPMFDLRQYLDSITIRQPRMVLGGIPDCVHDPDTCNSST